MLLLLAILPGVAILLWVWMLKKGEKPPKQMLLRIFLFGVLTMIGAIAVGLIGEVLVEDVLLPGSFLYLIIDNLLLTAAAEEGGKYIALKKPTWRSRAFRTTYDAVIYAVTASLGFATVENVFYVLDGDMGDAILRAVLSVPGHACYGVFMGCFYARARTAFSADDQGLVRRELTLAFWVPVVLHASYDLCIDLCEISDVFLALVLLYSLALYVVAFRLVRRLAREDAPVEVPSAEAPPVQPPVA